MSWHIWGGLKVMILETGCWLRPHTKRSKAPACSLVSITTGRVLDKMDSDRGEKEESRLSLLGLRARISLFALVWAEHEQAREEGYIVGPKGWVDMMYKTRRGESKKGKSAVGRNRKRQNHISKKWLFWTGDPAGWGPGLSVWMNPCVQSPTLWNFCTRSTFLL